MADRAPTALQAARTAASVVTFDVPRTPGRPGVTRYVLDVDVEGDIVAARMIEDDSEISVVADRDDTEDAVAVSIRSRYDGERREAEFRTMAERLRQDAAALNRFEKLGASLAAKMGISQTPVPGFMVGLSGTDSTIVFLTLYEAALRMGMPHRVVGIHYANQHRRKPTWYEEHIVPWLRERCPLAEIQVVAPLGGNQDQQRWADLNLRALNTVEIDEDGRTVTRALENGRNYWVAGCTNLTEQELGKFSTMSRGVSLMPIGRIRKSMIIRMCRALGVPAIAIEYAQQADCLCGRDELAAQNIDLIDAILTYDIRVGEHDPELLDRMFAYVRDQKRENGFKDRIPYPL